VFLFHGLGEHSGRYNHVAAAFNARNYAVFALDHHGTYTTQPFYLW
jgi:alpha-beta hydrolase superfamily lysophospholipase